MPDSGLHQRLEATLLKRAEKSALRKLITTDLIDFCSNDYLGFARSRKIHSRTAELYQSTEYSGSTGSRLLSGNNAHCEDLEKMIARFHGAESGLIFNSGFDANLGIFSTIPGSESTILFDELIHASVRDGIRLSRASSSEFAHNDLEDLRQQLKVSRGETFVAIESLYSMDGDLAPLRAIADLCKEFSAELIVDEAHATGVIGNEGKGAVCEADLEDSVFLRLHTFGKAPGAHGAIVLCSDTTRSFLINYCRSFIYTTALPPHSLCSVQAAYESLEQRAPALKTLQDRIALFTELVNGYPNVDAKTGPIQIAEISGNDAVVETSIRIQNQGFDVRPIRSPTVPAGKERVRICLHAFNTEEEIQELVRALRQ